jgi:peptidyl-prolyl cis-trans isomerase D
MMVKPIEDSAFQLQEGQTSGIIRSDFGFHIIHVTGVQPEKIKTLAEVHDAIANDLKQEAGAKKYAEAAEAFGNMVYEQGDSLSPVVEKWKLSLQQSGWLSKGGKLPPPFDNAKLAAALFSDDVLKAKHNTEAVETAPGNLVAARVVESKPASTQPFEAVKADIEKHLTQEAAMQLAMKDGEAKLAQLVKGGVVDLKWSSPHLVNRMATHDVPALSIQAIFNAKPLTCRHIQARDF